MLFLLILTTHPRDGFPRLVGGPLPPQLGTPSPTAGDMVSTNLAVTTRAESAVFV